MILMIDNYDSFTYNLVQYMGDLGKELLVKRNDEITIEEIRQLNPEMIMISPGPCTPNESGVSLDVIRTFAGEIPLFGVCLGHQAIAQVFGGKVVRSSNPVHGKTTIIEHDGKGIYKGIPQSIAVTRYHSLIVEPNAVPECLEVTSTNDEGIIMSLRHKEFPIECVQYHPESITTEYGMEMLQNFLKAYVKR